MISLMFYILHKYLVVSILMFWQKNAVVFHDSLIMCLSALSPPNVAINSITEDSMTLSITNDYKVQVGQIVFFSLCRVYVMTSFECKYNIDLSLSLSVTWSTTLSLFRGYLMNTWRRAGITLSWEHWKVKHFTVIKHPVSVSGRRYNLCALFCIATNLTAGMEYEVAVWAHTDDGDSPTALSRQQTKGTRPPGPSLKARALNQTAVDCNWTGPQAEVRLTHKRS